MVLKNLDIELLRTFIHVARSGSFTETAKKLYKTQSAISMQIKRLEESMNCKLFTREKKKASLTADGQFFLASANRVVNLNDELLLKFEKSRPNSVIKIGFPDDYATLFLPEILSLYSERFSYVELEVVCDTSSNLISFLNDDEIDIAVSIDFDGRYGNVIRKEALHWIASLNYQFDNDISIPLALFPEDCIIRKVALERIQKSELNWHLAFSGKNIATIHSLIAQGSAISVLGDSMVPDRCKILNEAQGFPVLPSLSISVNKRSGVLDLPARQLYQYVEAVISDKSIPTISRFGNVS